MGPIFKNVCFKGFQRPLKIGPLLGTPEEPRCRRLAFVVLVLVFMIRMGKYTSRPGNGFSLVVVFCKTAPKQACVKLLYIHVLVGSFPSVHALCCVGVSETCCEC